MKKSKQKSKIFHSLVEIEKEYLPQNYKKKLEKEITDPKIIGINLAKETLKKIKIYNKKMD